MTAWRLFPAGALLAAAALAGCGGGNGEPPATSTPALHTLPAAWLGAFIVFE